MPITASRGSESFTVENPNALTEVALVLAELNRRWGHRGTLESFSKDLNRILTLAHRDPQISFRELEVLERNSIELQLLEELARGFQEAVAEDGAALIFEGSLAEGIETVRSYARAVGAKIETSGG